MSNGGEVEAHFCKTESVWHWNRHITEDICAMWITISDTTASKPFFSLTPEKKRE